MGHFAYQLLNPDEIVIIEASDKFEARAVLSQHFTQTGFRLKMPSGHLAVGECIVTHYLSDMLAHFNILSEQLGTTVNSRKYYYISYAQPIVSSKNNNSGMRCKFCQDYAQYAEANLDGGEFACYSCRRTESWRIGL